MINLNNNNDIKDTQEFKGLMVNNYKNLIAQIMVEAFDCADKIGNGVGQNCKFPPHVIAYLESESFSSWCDIAEFNQATIAKAIVTNNGIVSNSRYITETLCPTPPKHIDIKIENTIDTEAFLADLDEPNSADMEEAGKFEQELEWDEIE